MPTIQDGDEEEGASDVPSNLKFEVLTLLAWLGALVLLIASVKHALKAHLNLPKLAMPAVHLAPWCIALLERRRIRTTLSLTPQYQSLVQAAITRVSWVGYVTLSLVEYWLY
jgi:hypothetical protein